MKCLDFHIHAEQGFSDGFRVAGRCLHLGEAVRWELRLQKGIEAPFRKLVVNLCNLESTDLEPRCSGFQGIMEVWVGVHERRLLEDYPTFRSDLKDAIGSGLDIISREMKWTPQDFRSLMRSVFGRDRVFHYAVPGLSAKLGSSGRSAKLYFDLTDKDSTVSLALLDSGGSLVRQHVLRTSDKPTPLEYLFPARTLKIRGDVVVVRDAKGNALASIQLGNELPESS
jgi:hypothetical protein